MSKISVSRILRDHIKTLRASEKDAVSKPDLFLFYGLPLIIAFIVVDFSNPTAETDWNGQALTFFGIFLALLINVQVALFAILQRGRSAQSSSKRANLQAADLELRRALLGEINATISYLNLVCVIALAISLSMSVASVGSRAAVLVLLIFYSHFLLTMLMVLKRSHALFQKEYEKS